MTWVMNSIYESDESICTQTTGVSSSNRRKNSYVSRSEYNHEILPMWLQAKESMIYSKHTVQKGQQIGQGQYGTVFKGTIVLGSSV